MPGSSLAARTTGGLSIDPIPFALCQLGSFSRFMKLSSSAIEGIARGRDSASDGRYDG